MLQFLFIVKFFRVKTVGENFEKKITRRKTCLLEDRFEAYFLNGSFILKVHSLLFREN